MLLSVKNLSVGFKSSAGYIEAVKNLSFDLEKNKTLCIVGESGSGKSVTSLSIMGLLDKEAKITNGEIIYRGNNLLKVSERRMRKIRGSEIAMIFQDPMTCLNPVFKVGYQLKEVIEIHQKHLSKKEVRNKVSESLELVGIKNIHRCLEEYPFKLSGGQRQRVMIAMAMLCRPSVLIADEPTTALDVTIQAQVLTLMKDIQKEYKMSTLFITHDLGVVSQIADDVLVMYKGDVVESGTVRDVLDDPRHPYTKALLGSLPEKSVRKSRLDFVHENIDYLKFPKEIR